ncbi:type VII toxin-antitoxin system HepT family RNase toxin [Gottfriedia acidiceleris]|uniref:type VII toxin-antitoxin system HepT family RNase toxin n=1 Tax=Gottfriedia acidiceleris TaxID=371036 RepID=UPI002FFEF2F3
MNNQVILNKISTIERCITRINEVYDLNSSNLNDYTKQDSIILNIQRACEACIDLAMHLVAVRKLGIPQSSRDAFDLLVANSLLDHELSMKLKAMIGFRNIAVHDYQSVNLDIVEKIIENHLGDFKQFTQHILKITDTF